MRLTRGADLPSGAVGARARDRRSVRLRPAAAHRQIACHHGGGRRGGNGRHRPGCGSQRIDAASGAVFDDERAAGTVCVPERGKRRHLRHPHRRDPRLLGRDVLVLPAGSFPGTYTHVSRLGGVCAVQTSGALSCWASSDDNLASVPAGAFVEVAIGESAACARRADRSVACWGRGRKRAPGLRLREPDRRGLLLLRAGDRRSRGRVLGAPLPGREVVQVISGPFVAVDTGRFFACGLRPDGSVSCWSASFPPGHQRLEHVRPAVAAAGPVRRAERGRVPRLRASRRRDTSSCWGADTYGQSTPPADVAFTQVSAGSNHTCGILPDGSVVCWGGSCNPWG